MDIEFDPAKNEKNICERGLSFGRVTEFDFSSAVVWRDTRFNYPEVRYSALGMVRGRLHSLVFSRLAVGVRVISFRKANRREVKRYETES